MLDEHDKRAEEVEVVVVANDNARPGPERIQLTLDRMYTRQQVSFEHMYYFREKYIQDHVTSTGGTLSQVQKWDDSPSNPPGPIALKPIWQLNANQRVIMVRDLIPDELSEAHKQLVGEELGLEGAVRI